MITGKNKERFENWYNEKLIFQYIKLSISLRGFYNLPFEMQQGVLLAYYDESNIFINVEHNEIARKYHYSIYFKPMRDDVMTMSIFKTRNKTYQEAFKQADKLENERLNK